MSSRKCTTVEDICRIDGVSCDNKIKSQISDRCGNVSSYEQDIKITIPAGMTIRGGKLVPIPCKKK